MFFQEALVLFIGKQYLETTFEVLGMFKVTQLSLLLALWSGHNLEIFFF